MTFAQQEESRDEGAPIFLYLFIYGPGLNDYYGYTSGEKTVIYGGRTYTPQTISHGDITQTGNLDKTNLDVRAPTDVDLIDAFVDQYSSVIVGLVVYAGHVESTDFKAEWAGKVLGVKRLNAEATYSCEPAVGLRRVGLNRKSQIGCPVLLYGPLCKASLVAASSTTTAQEIDGPYVTLPPGWNAHGEPDDYEGGMITWTTAQGRVETRTIEQVDVNVTRLSARASGLTAGLQVTVSLGCRHTRADCAALHNNILNYQGHDWIPGEVPIGIKNVFY